MSTKQLDNLTYIAYQSIMDKKHSQIAVIAERCEEIDEFASELKTYMRTNNPFYILDIESFASDLYWEILNLIEFEDLAEKITEHLYGEKINNELPY
jgi:hypothetical protein